MESTKSITSEVTAPSSTESIEVRKVPAASRVRRYNPWKSHTRKIFLACAIVVVPMFAFTIAFIWIVFANLVDKTRCPYEELCPDANVLNMTTDGYYYVDFPAARLVFISSWSSTISFSFVSMLMTLFGYLIASQLLRTSVSTMEWSERSLPSPYQTSLLMRVLNADLLSLWDLCSNKITNIFWSKQRSNDLDAKSPWVLRSSILVFLFCMLGSILVQAADTYLHIVTEATELTQIQTQSNITNMYSQGIAPWCLNRESVGSMNNKNFWGCAVAYDPVAEYAGLNNMTVLNQVEAGIAQNTIYNYTDEYGVRFSLVGPTHAPMNVDWKASTVGVSSQCSAIPSTACTRTAPPPNVTHDDVQEPFHCTKDKAGVEVNGSIWATMSDIYFFDFHKYYKELYPFSSGDLIGWNYGDIIEDSVIEGTKEDEEVFLNPWTSLGLVTIAMDAGNYPEALKEQQGLWNDVTTPYNYTIILCNNTVWDITYTAFGRNVTSISATKSNSSVTGMASMPALGYWYDLSLEYNKAQQEASASPQSLDDFVGSYAAGLTKVFAYPIATQLSARPALLAQIRTSKVITQVPVAAFWLLIIANMLYALLGVLLAILALCHTSPSVHQVYTRLSITGIVAQLFEREYAEREVGSEEELFRENVERGMEIKRVGVRRTDTGGSRFDICEKDSDN